MSRCIWRSGPETYATDQVCRGPGCHVLIYGIRPVTSCSGMSPIPFSMQTSLHSLYSTLGPSSAVLLAKMHRRRSTGKQYGRIHSSPLYRSLLPPLSCLHQSSQWRHFTRSNIEMCGRIKDSLLMQTVRFREVCLTFASLCVKTLLMNQDHWISLLSSNAKKRLKLYKSAIGKKNKHLYQKNSTADNKLCPLGPYEKVISCCTCHQSYWLHCLCRDEGNILGRSHYSHVLL